MWNDAYYASERVVAVALAERTGQPESGRPDEDFGRPGATDARLPLRLRLAAGAASTAVRVAVESWAASDDPADGPDGPAALAVRCIASLGECPWSTS